MSLRNEIWNHFLDIPNIKAIGSIFWFRHLDYWPRLLAPNRSKLSPDEAFALIFFELVSFNAARNSLTFISFVVILLTEASVKESDGIKKTRLTPPPPPPLLPLHGDPWCSLDALVNIVMTIHSVKLRAYSHDPRTTHCPRATHWPRGQLCLSARSDACNCSHEFFVALG